MNEQKNERTGSLIRLPVRESDSILVSLVQLVQALLDNNDDDDDGDATVTRESSCSSSSSSSCS